MFKKILVPLDFSKSSELSVRVATDLGRTYGGTLLLMHVREPVLSGELLAFAAPIVEPTDFDLRLEAVKADLRREGMSVDARCVTGDAIGQILELAQFEACDLIVMGTHGRTGLGHLLMGSVAESVLRRAPCPVLTVRAAKTPD